MNKEKCIEKAIKFILEAGEQGANIIVFKEEFIHSYPRGMSFGAVVGSRSDKRNYTRWQLYRKSTW